MRLFLIIAVMLLAFSAATMGQELGRNPIYEVDEYEVLSFVIDSLICRHPFSPGAIIAVDQTAHCSWWTGKWSNHERPALLEDILFEDFADSTIEQICTDLDRKCAESSRWVLSFHFRKPYIWARPKARSGERRYFDNEIRILASRVAFDKSGSIAYCSIEYNMGSGHGSAYTASLRKVDGKWTLIEVVSVVE